MCVWERESESEHRSGGNLRHVPVTDDTSVQLLTLILSRWGFANASLLVESRKHWSERWMDECGTLSHISSLYLLGLFVACCCLYCDRSFFFFFTTWKKSLNICQSHRLHEINRTKPAPGLLCAFIHVLRQEAILLFCVSSCSVVKKSCLKVVSLMKTWHCDMKHWHLMANNLADCMKRLTYSATCCFKGVIWRC